MQRTSDEIEPIYDPTSDWDDHIDAKAVLATLTPKQRRVVLLYAQGLTQEDIAKCLGISQQTVQEHLDKIKIRD